MRGGGREAEEGRGGLVSGTTVGEVEGHHTPWVMLEKSELGGGDVLSVCAETGA